MTGSFGSRVRVVGEAFPMKVRVIGVSRETEFSPGKVTADAAILRSVLAHLRALGAETEILEATRFAAERPAPASLVLAMCQGAPALSRLASVEESGAVTINSALAIRNCYRDLLGAGLEQAGVPIPDGALIRTSTPFDFKPLRALDVSSPMYVKRGNLHALGPDDVRRIEHLGQLEATLLNFAERGIGLAYVQQEVVGEDVKFYGVGGSEFFSVVPASGHPLRDSVRLSLERAARDAAAVLGLEVWGGDAVIAGSSCKIIDFNDWPSFEAIREDAAAAIARRAMRLFRRQPLTRTSVI
jgi:glutathione synthase/RimK-type ligase-like ATP-grasp enzyme